MVSSDSRLLSEESGEIWTGKKGRGLSPVEAGKLRRMSSVRLRCSDCSVEARHVTGAMSWRRPIRGLGWRWWRVMAEKEEESLACVENGIKRLGEKSDALKR